MTNQPANWPNERKRKVLEAIIESFENLRIGMIETMQLLIVHKLSMIELLKKAGADETFDREHSESVHLARKELRNDFLLTTERAIVSAWAMLEASLEDFMITWLTHNPEFLLSNDKFKRIKIPAQTLAIGIDDQMRQVMKALKEQESLQNQTIIGRFEYMFEVLGLKDASIHKQLEHDLIEMYGVRNLIVHRRGVVDDEFSRRCPWTQRQAGERLIITNDDYNRYTQAANEYAFEVIRRVKRYLGVQG